MLRHAVAALAHAGDLEAVHVLVDLAAEGGEREVRALVLAAGVWPNRMPSDVPKTGDPPATGCAPVATPMTGSAFSR